ncbi:site-specific DNA-methyltransferase [Streptococcus ruminicola]|uniref:site-specific DNA-methyltransferase n=1 Tax=Streptococcus ruminicola TaxID=2686210 RepID=UPI003F5DE407
MDKMDMKTSNIADKNYEALLRLFPNAITEKINDSGEIERAIDVDVLRQEISGAVVEGKEERFQFTWPDKKKAMILSNIPITGTLRPVREKSLNFDNTENLYIEGDNLDVLKLLQETYLGKIKVIYIDPPYNTGNDFVYEDDFVESMEDYRGKSGYYDEDGNRLVKNLDSNGRFHTDWLNMIYPRLKLAKNLLTDDGAIFISIDENEADKMKIICDEIFGKDNYRNQLLVRRRIKSLNLQFADNGLNSFNVAYEYILVYSKSSEFLFNPLRVEKEDKPEKGTWNVFWSNADRPTMRYEILGFTPTTGQWRWQKNLAEEAVENYRIYEEEFSSEMSLEEYYQKTGKNKRFIRRIPNGVGKNGGVQYWVAPNDTSLRTSNWTDLEVSQIAKEYDLPFENPKNIGLAKEVVKSVPGDDFYVLDFFSGSGTTADAVMRLNAEDGGNRKFIMVQINQNLDNPTEQYKTICDIGRERIKQAGEKIYKQFDTVVDTGYRTLTLDSSNMKEVFYNPAEIQQTSLFEMADNIKDGRTPEDLLFQVMLDLGVLLSSKIEKVTIADKEVFNVAEGFLIACFDNDVTEDVVKKIAEKKPYYAVFRDSSMASDSVATNFEQIFASISPDTVRKVL